MKRPGLFLDRDGVINVDHGYVHRQENFEFKTGIFDLVQTANDLGYVVIVATNQAGIGRGYYSEKDFLNLTDWMREEFQRHSAKIDAVYFCPSHPTEGIGIYRQDSEDRKPNPGMLLKAAQEHEIDLSQSILIGDKISDMEAGERANIRTLILFQDQENTPHLSFPYQVIDKLDAAKSLLLKLHSQRYNP